MIRVPTIINFPKIGDSSSGFISLAENENLPFAVKRVYWTYFTPENVERGGHSHIDLEQILVAVAGTIIVKTEMSRGLKNTFVLDDPSIGLFIPQKCWREMKYKNNAVQMCLASIVYDESDYIREYEVFKQRNHDKV